MKTDAFLWIFFSFLSMTFCSGQEATLPEYVVSECYGDLFSFDCGPGHKIRINRDFFGYGQSEMCRYSSGDCIISNPKSNSLIHRYCTGRVECTYYLVERRGCDGFFSNYQQVEYQCVPDSVVTNVCSNVEFETSNTYISSPNFPDNYPANLNCHCVVTSVPRNERVRMEIVHMAVKFHDPCRDWLRIGRSKICGTRIDLFRGRRIPIEFHSDDDESHSGFWLHFQSSRPDTKIHVKCGRGPLYRRSRPTTSTTTKEVTTLPATSTTPVPNAPMINIQRTFSNVDNTSSSVKPPLLLSKSGEKSPPRTGKTRSENISLTSREYHINHIRNEPPTTQREDIGIEIENENTAERETDIVHVMGEMIVPNRKGPLRSAVTGKNTLGTTDVLEVNRENGSQNVEREVEEPLQNYMTKEQKPTASDVAGIENVRKQLVMKDDLENNPPGNQHGITDDVVKNPSRNTHGITDDMVRNPSGNPYGMTDDMEKNPSRNPHGMTDDMEKNPFRNPYGMTDDMEKNPSRNIHGIIDDMIKNPSRNPYGKTDEKVKNPPRNQHAMTGDLEKNPANNQHDMRDDIEKKPSTITKLVAADLRDQLKRWWTNFGHLERTRFISREKTDAEDDSSGKGNIGKNKALLVHVDSLEKSQERNLTRKTTRKNTGDPPLEKINKEVLPIPSVDRDYYEKETIEDTMEQVDNVQVDNGKVSLDNKSSPQKGTTGEPIRKEENRANVNSNKEKESALITTPYINDSGNSSIKDLPILTKDGGKSEQAIDHHSDQKNVGLFTRMKTEVTTQAITDSAFTNTEVVRETKSQQIISEDNNAINQNKTLTTQTDDSEKTTEQDQNSSSGFQGKKRADDNVVRKRINGILVRKKSMIQQNDRVLDSEEAPDITGFHISSEIMVANGTSGKSDVSDNPLMSKNSMLTLGIIIICVSLAMGLILLACALIALYVKRKYRRMRSEETQTPGSRVSLASGGGKPLSLPPGRPSIMHRGLRAHAAACSMPTLCTLPDTTSQQGKGHQSRFDLETQTIPSTKGNVRAKPKELRFKLDKCVQINIESIHTEVNDSDDTYLVPAQVWSTDSVRSNGAYNTINNLPGNHKGVQAKPGLIRVAMKPRAQLKRRKMLKRLPKDASSSSELRSSQLSSTFELTDESDSVDEPRRAPKVAPRPPIAPKPNCVTGRTKRKGKPVFPLVGFPETTKNPAHSGSLASLSGQAEMIKLPETTTIAAPAQTSVGSGDVIFMLDDSVADDMDWETKSAISL